MDPDYRLILDTLGEAVIAADRTGRITYANAAAEELLGWPSGGLRGLPVTAVIPPHLRARHTAGFNRYRSSWQPRILGRGVRLPARRRNGVEVPVELTLTTFRGRGGQEIYLAALHDPSRRLEPGRAAAAPDALTTVLEALRLLDSGSISSKAGLAWAVERALEYHFQASLAQLWICDAGRLRAPGERQGETEPPPMALEALQTGETVLHDGAGEPLELLPGHEMVAGVAALPLQWGGATAGVLVYGTRSLLSPAALRPLELFGRAVAAALGELDRREAEAEGARIRGRLQAVQRLAEYGAEGRSASELLDRLVRLSLELTELDEALLLAREPPIGEVVLAAHGSKFPEPDDRLPPGSTIASLVLTSGTVEAVDDYRELPKALPQLRQRGVRACTAAPIRVRGEVVAALQLASRKSARSITAGDRETLLLLAVQAGAILARE